MQRTKNGVWALVVGGCGMAASLVGCAGQRTPGADEWALRQRLERYRVEQAERIVAPGTRSELVTDAGLRGWERASRAMIRAQGDGYSGRPDSTFTLGTLAPFGEPAAQTQPAETRPVLPDGYWRADVWHQMGREALALGGHDFWKGFKTSYWNVPNALVLTATMGASIAIRETGVDDTIAGRVKGHRQLGDLDETIQIIGHPGTHFAGAGLLWLGSALTQDMKSHEVAKSLAQALAVNGVSTILLKVSANTSAPDDERFAWPSGHTSSAFTVAAVLNEYYGPWVGVPSLALAGLVGYQRIDSRVHDFSDVVFGAMLGYVIGASIAHDNQARFPEVFGMQVIPYADPETGTTGLALLKQW